MQGFLVFFAWASLAAGVILAGVNTAAFIVGTTPVTLLGVAVTAAWLLGGFFWFVLCKAAADALDALEAIRARLR